MRPRPRWRGRASGLRDSDEDVALLEAARNELLIARDAGNFVHPEDVQDS